MATPGGERYSTKIRAKRIALSYFKEPHPFRRWRFILSVALPAVGGLWLLLYAVQGDQRIYNSGPVSTAHTMFEKDCAVCHGPGPAMAATPGSANASAVGIVAAVTTAEAAAPHGRYWARVTDNACQACHAGPQHHGNETFTPTCGSCHVEHGGRALLVQIADQHCVQCHGDLKTKEGATPYKTSITRLREHPEFAVNVREGAKVERVRLDDKAQLRDTAAMKLNHVKHLKVNLKGVEDVAKQGGVGLVKGKDGMQLACSFCHRPDNTWHYMQPVNYKDHCAICHELSSGIGDMIVPHDKPTIVQAFMRGAAGEAFDACQSIPKGAAGKALRERCEGLGLAAAAPEATEDQPRGRRRGGGDEAPAPDAPRGGRLRGGAFLTPPAPGLSLRRALAEIILAQDDSPRGGRRLRGGGDEEAPPAGGGGGGAAGGSGGGGGGGGGAAWVGQMLASGDKKLFQTKEDGCEKCHVLKRTDGQPVAEVVPTAIPLRWLPHSRFDHGPHRPVACVECHKATLSSETKDVLMPSITTCRDCHRGTRTAARSGCVECHRYHDKSKERDADGPFRVQQLTTGLGGRPSNRLR